MRHRKTIYFFMWPSCRNASSRLHFLENISHFPSISVLNFAEEGCWWWVMRIVIYEWCKKTVFFSLLEMLKTEIYFCLKQGNTEVDKYFCYAIIHRPQLNNNIKSKLVCHNYMIFVTNRWIIRFLSVSCMHVAKFYIFSCAVVLQCGDTQHNCFLKCSLQGYLLLSDSKCIINN